jgi:hypothetical protein
MTSPRRPLLTEIPRDIYRQEIEIELIYRNLVWSSDEATSLESQVWFKDPRRQEATAWVLIVLLGFVCLVGLYLLWTKA